MSARSRDIITASLTGAGIVGAGELFFCCAASTNAQGSYWKDWFDNDRYFAGNNSPGSAHTVMTAGRNDVLLVASDAMITCTEAISWDSDLCHMVGMYPGAPGQRSGRARIGASGNFTPLLTVDGYGCMFYNVHLMHGQGSTANENLVVVNSSGARAMFKNVHFACYNATEMTGSSYAMISIGDCSEICFHDCYIGSDSLAMAAGTCVEFEAGATIRSVWQNCNFGIHASSASVTFLKWAAGVGGAINIFKDCLFINKSSTACTVGIDSAGLNNARAYFDAGCMFAGVTDVAAAAQESYVLWSPTHLASTDNTGYAKNVGIAVSFDHTTG